MKEDPSGSGSWAKGAAYMGLAFVPAIAGWLGYKAGEYADSRFGTGWLGITGLLLGLAAGIYDLLRQAKRIEGRGSGS